MTLYLSTYGSDMGTAWDIIEDDTRKPATLKQRRALYRLGYGTWLVHKLTKDQATQAINDGLKLMALVKAKEEITL